MKNVTFTIYAEVEERMMRKQHYMTYEERLKLEALYNAARMPVAKIAKALGFARQTIYNELRRGRYVHTYPWWDEVRYSADKAQQLHRYNQTAKGRPLKIESHHDYAQFLEDKIIRDRYSPAAALASARKLGFAVAISVNTLYSYIEKKVFLKLSNKHLWRKSQKKEREKAEKRVAHPALPSIADRPWSIGQRLEPGHWEMDLIVGKAKTRACLLTLTERLTRRELIFKLPNRKAATVRAVFDQLERTTPNFREVFKSVTTDNGSEFLEFEKLRQSIYDGTRFDVWYCHSYAAWEKGSNENHNRMIRRWFPKGTDFTRVTKKRVAAVQDWMNNYPRKILNWRSPNELAA